MILLLAMLACGAAEDATVLAPIPRSLRMDCGTLEPLEGDAPESGDWQRVREILTAMMSAAQEDRELVLACSQEAVPKPQGYELRITPARIELVAHDAPGAWYGAMTLRQLLRQGDPPTVVFRDWPAFPVRGFLLDVSRDRIPTMATLMDLVVRLSELKYNQLQLYMEHTFAYADHQGVWSDASPFTAAEIRALHAWCARHFIELVPCQNSLAHMERWLEHPRYRSMAEVPESPSCLCPIDPDARAFMGKLYDELLPNFTSRKFNICCDEAWQVGTGRSREAVEKQGKTKVYFDYLMDMRRRALTHVDEVLFWGDMLVPFHVEPDPETGFYRPLPRDPSPLLQGLPRDMTALVWGYRPDDPLEAMAREYAEAGVRFYVCPGTSSWCSFLGRHDRMVGNVRAAIAAARKHDAAGILMCDWNWRGWDPLTVSWPGIVYASAMAWAPDQNRDISIPCALDTHIFNDPSRTIGGVLCTLANVYQLPDHSRGRALVNLPLLMQPLLNPDVGLSVNLSQPGLEQAVETIDEQLRILRRVETCDPFLRRAAVELDVSARLVRHLCMHLKSQLASSSEEVERIPAETPEQLATELKNLLEMYPGTWRAASRCGDLERSLAPWKDLLDSYR